MRSTLTKRAYSWSSSARRLRRNAPHVAGEDARTRTPSPAGSRMALLLHLVLLLLLRAAAGGNRFDPSRAVHVSRRPRAFMYEGFLTDAECDHLVALAKEEGALRKSTVVDRETGRSVMSVVRTSSGMFLSKKQDEIVARIEERIAASTGYGGPENGEQIQILRYENGQKYEPHFDFIRRRGNYRDRGGHRVATVLMYLSDVEMGGETIFPNSDSKLAQRKDDTWSECARRGYAVKPVKGDAVLFFSLHPNATTDQDSLHGSCPVIQGEKWSATKWIHVRSFDNGLRVPAAAAGGCEDENALCHWWADEGECAKNPRYMVGTRDSPGFCRRSCNACTTP